MGLKRWKWGWFAISDSGPTTSRSYFVRKQLGTGWNLHALGLDLGLDL